MLWRGRGHDCTLTWLSMLIVHRWLTSPEGFQVAVLTFRILTIVEPEVSPAHFAQWMKQFALFITALVAVPTLFVEFLEAGVEEDFTWVRMEELACSATGAFSLCKVPACFCLHLRPAIVFFLLLLLVFFSTINLVKD